MMNETPADDDSYRPPIAGEDYEDPEARRSEGIIPQYPGTDHSSKFHAREGDWRSPSATTDLRCDLAVHRLLAAALGGVLGITNPAEFGALHGAAYDLVHDPGIDEELEAREQLMALIERMAPRVER
jgi:hypothetical protein